MFRNLIKLLVVGLVLYAGFKITPVFWTHIKFKDAVAETAKFSAARSEQDIRQRVLALATSMDVPLDPNVVRVRKVNQVTIIDASYWVDLEYFPTRTYPWEFVVKVEGEPPRYGDLIP
ncbi:MAG: hypothetical protein KJ066_10940 [Acidobacteria bacterium]|nr:hypothetical protein [Acidobacteriota bacterium]